MEDLSYIVGDTFILRDGKGNKLQFGEAKAIECIEHHINIKKSTDEEFIYLFIIDFISEFSQDEIFDITTVEVDDLYNKILQKRFMGFFGRGEVGDPKSSAPFSATLALLGKFGDPYLLLAKRTWRQCLELIEGYIYNSNAQQGKEGAKENQKLVMRKRARESGETTKQTLEANKKAVELYQLNKRNANTISRSSSKA